MNPKAKKLPALNSGKAKTIFDKDRTRIQDLLLENAKNRLTHKDYRNQQEFTQLKAANFLSRIETVDNPQVIFAVADQVGQQAKCQNKENEAIRADKQIRKNSSYRCELNKMNQERFQAVNLAKWMDQRLAAFKKKKPITFMDILDYKQTVLNYSLGRIIDSLTKKCKEEGQLLSLIWNNTFTMFEGVFNILMDANSYKQKEHMNQQEELHQMFETNHNFLREQKEKLVQQNQMIFQKMKKVILWNKRLRKDRKTLNTANRILQYRNQTYSQALEQTIQMLLKTSPEPAAIQTSKKIIQKLSKEKNRKRRFYQKQQDQQFGKTTKEFVYKWLKCNSCLNQDFLNFFNETPFTKEDEFFMQDLDDINDMKTVDIYDFFKLYDVGVQATVDMKNEASQSQTKVLKSVEVMTKYSSTIEHGCQTVYKHESKQSTDYLQQRKLGKAAGTSKQFNNSSKARNEKSKKKGKDKDLLSNKSIKNHKKNQTANEDQKKYDKNQYYHRISNRQVIRQNMRNGKANIVEKQIKDQDMLNNFSVGFKFDQENQDALEEKHCSNSFISDLEEDQDHTRGPTTRHLLTVHSITSRIKSMNQIPQQYGSSRNLVVNAIGRKRGKKNSVAYIADRLQSKSITGLNVRKRFAETFKESKDLMESNREEFVDQIIRRRSFYGKKKVQFSTYKSAEEGTQKVREYYRGRQFRIHKTLYQHFNYMTSHIQKLTKKIAGPSNMTKTKALISSKSLISSIIGSLDQIARMPPSNKAFANNSMAMITKYIEGLIPDYIKQVKKQKEELISDCQKVLYPLNILLMEQMTFKYGLKDIASKKIKNFIEKVLTFAPISQKIGLYSLLLGLQDPEIGSDQLLIYIKCLVYFDCKKAIRDGAMIESTTVDIQLVRQNLKKVLEYFFDHEYVNLLELKLQIYFQQTAPFSTVEGITLIIIKELLKRKKQLKLKYLQVHQLCSFGDSFFTNIYKLLKIVSNYQQQAAVEVEKHFKYSKQEVRESVQSIEALQKIRNRNYKRKKIENNDKPINNYDINKISFIIRDLLQRSDIIDEEFGKSITSERFVTAAVIYGIPTFKEVQKIMDYFQIKFNQLKEIYPIYGTINENNHIDLERLANLWLKSSVYKSEEQVVNMWSLSRIYADKIEEEVVTVMGKIGNIGLYIESSLLSKGALFQ